MNATRALACLTFAALSACAAEDVFELSLSPNSFVADGLTKVTVTVEAVTRGVAADGKSVTLRANAPVLFSTDAVLPGRGKSEVTVTAKGGEARAYLLAPVEETALELTASMRGPDGLLTDAVDVSVGPALVAGTDGAGAPRFAFSCYSRRSRPDDIENVGAFVPNRPEIRVPCSLIAEDARGNPLPHAKVRFEVEAGEIEDVAAVGSEARELTYVVPIVAEPPLDVAPMAGEDVDGSHNQRDGLVTILALTRGQEGFEDLNGNGVHDSNEPWEDEGEPFLDKDDDGVYTPGEYGDGPICAGCDWDGNGEIDGPNGLFDSDVIIGRRAHVLWTGVVSQVAGRSAISPPSAHIPADGAVDMTLSVVDINFNPVAAGTNGDELKFVKRIVSPSGGSATYFLFRPPTFLAANAGDAALPNVTGFELNTDPTFRYDDSVYFGLDRTDATSIFWQWPFTLEDARVLSGTSPTQAKCKTWTYTFEVTVRYTPVPGMTARSDVLSASGELEALSGVEPCP